LRKGEDLISGESQSAAGGAEHFAEAYKALRADSSIQFNLAPPPARPKPPGWLEALLRWLDDHLFAPVGRALAWIGSFFPDAAYARIILWIVIGAGAAVLAWALFNRLRHGDWSLRLRGRVAAGELRAEEDWTPELAGARSWLDEADALAREGRFAEAIHHLLFRSIEDIRNRRPNLVRPALTSRELAASKGLPGRARELFAAIAQLVEQSLFGGRPVSEGDWLAARTAYSDFALPAAWRP
jgi:Domain of unknown function (DUF4129)